MISAVLTCSQALKAGNGGPILYPTMLQQIIITIMSSTT